MIEKHQHSKPILVSVIIPCYNQGHFLKECIESVLNQTYGSCEIIVVDDGSSDSTRYVTLLFPQVKYVHQSNTGPGQARNKGFKVSEGDYLVFLDADDRLLPDALDAGADCLNNRPECAFVSGHIRMIAEDGSFIRTPEIACVRDNHYRTLLQYNYIWTTGSVMFRRTVFESSSGFDTTLVGPEDWKLYLRITRIHPVCCHEKVVVDHRMHKGKLTCNAALLLRDSLKMLRQESQYIQGNKKYEDALRKGIKETQLYWSKPLIDQIIEQVSAYKWKEAARNILALLRHYPSGFVKALTPHYLAVLFGIEVPAMKKPANS